MTLLALGWIPADARPPAPMHVIGSGPVKILAAASEALPDSRARLAAQLQSHAAGCDLLPFAPARAVPLDTAQQELAGITPATERALRRLRGMGQLCLSLVSLSAPDAPAQSDNGRAWLRDRALAATAQQRDRRRLQDLLLGLIRTLPHRASTPRAHPHCCKCELLVPRHAIAETVTTLRKQAAFGPDDCDLIVAGPLPAYNFTADPDSIARAPCPTE